jgi:DUF971 family protein
MGKIYFARRRRHGASVSKRNPLTALSFLAQDSGMRVELEKLDVIGSELALCWSDQSETFIQLEFLRHRCPCAGCAGEKDLMGKVYKAEERPLIPASFQWKHCSLVGNYAIMPEWGDGHQTGIYSFEYLRSLGSYLDDPTSILSDADDSSGHPVARSGHGALPNPANP